MLKEIALVTLTVTNLAQVEKAWEEHFNYRVMDRGEVSAALSAHWAAPAMAGSEFITMQPSNGAPVYVRFVADQTVAGYRPMTSHGWNATELLVTDPDSLRAAMTDKQFDVIGEPRDLWPAPNAPRVMQALGPGGELLYLTRNDGAAAGLGLDESMPPVERAFIMVVGGPSMTDFLAFYRDKLGLQADPPNPFKITMISKANNLPVDTTYPLAVVQLAPGYLIELDELPQGIGPREVTKDRLPPGIAVVSFTVDALPREGFEWISPPQALKEFPYGGHRVAITRGPAGELIEMIAPAVD